MTRPAHILVVLLSAPLILLPAGCQRADEAPPPGAALVVSADTAGWLTPCGCTSNQSGGLPRRGAYIRTLGQGQTVIAVDVGGAAGGTSAYHRLKFEAILSGEMAMGVGAHNLGRAEVALGPEYLRQVAQRLSVPFVSANVRDAAGGLIAPPLRILQAPGRRLAVVGVLSRRYASGNLRIDEPRQSILNALQSAQGQFDALIVLAYLPEDELLQLAQALPEADLVLGGPTHQPIAPRAVGPVTVASATNKGKFLLHLPVAAKGAPWQGQVVEMGTGIGDDAEQLANMRQYLARLGQRDFAASETGLAPPLPSQVPRGYRIAGDKSCFGCHEQECRIQAASRHARAWESIQAKGSHVDPYCQSCHTTGYGLPGGFASIARSPGLAGVGCESCHGPSMAHVNDPKQRTTFAAADQCTRCHDHENSPAFEYAGYWARIKHDSLSAKSAQGRQEGK